MGAIQNGVLDHNGTVIGVMPKELDTKEITSQRVSELILVDSLHQRKENGRISRCFYPRSRRCWFA